MTDGESAIVRVSAFVKRYKQHIAVDGADLEIRRGEIYGLIGADGCGKSSLMKAIAGVLSHEGGTIEVFGTAIDSEAAAERVKHRLGFLPQGLGLSLYPELSVEENIDFFARLRLVPERQLAERKARLLAMTRLDQFRTRTMRNLSGGMKQKLGLICTLIHEPQLAILDEPTTGVDPVSRRDFWAILAELVQEKDTTVLVSTAYMDEAERFDRLSLLSGGKVFAAGTPSEIRKQTPGSLVSVTARAQSDAAARLNLHYRQVETRGPLLHVFTDEVDHARAAEQVHASLGDIEAQQLHVSEPELEDVFIALLLRQSERPHAPPLRVATAHAVRDGLAIEARELVRDFGSFRAVDRVSFTVKPGEVFGLLGANGAGKTTVIKMLNGILPPTDGEGSVAGADMRSAGATIKERIGYMSQAFSLYLDLTVAENVRLFAGIYGLDRKTTNDRLEWILSMAGLKGHESSLTARLPMGYRQRLALGCALIHRPRVLFLDEPTSGVDPIGRRQFWDILSRLAREQGVAILVTTHYMSEAEHCDHLALMYAGRIVADGSPEAMKQSVEDEAGHLFALTSDRPRQAASALRRAGFAGVALHGTRVHLFGRDPIRDGERAAQVLASDGVHLQSITQRALSLEDVFVYRVMALEQQDRVVA